MSSTTDGAVTRSPIPSRPASPTVGLQALPVEVLLLILNEARGGGRSLRASYMAYMLTCRFFLGPARSLLHSQVLLTTYDQAAGFLRAISSDTSLSPATRRLTLITGKEDRSLPSRGQAARILRLCYNIRDLTLIADEDESKMWRKSLAHSAPGGGAGLAALESLKTSKIRYDRLAELLQDSPSVQYLDVTGLYELQSNAPKPEEDRNSDAEESDWSSDDDDDQTTAQQQFQELRRQVAPGTSRSVVTRPDSDAESNAPSSSPPPSSPRLPPSLSLPLRCLTLSSSTVMDATTLELCKGSSSTLTTLRLIRTTTLTRQGLLEVLSTLPNLLTFELSGSLPPPRSTDPALAAQLHPLDQLPQLTPFLQWLKIDSDNSASSEILTKLAQLPLSDLSIGFALPRLGADDVARMLDRIPPGRLDSLFIGVGMKWSAQQLDEVRRCCESVGTMFAGEPYEPHSFF